MKTALKRENGKFSAMSLKPVSGLIGLGNRPRIPNLWAIAHENSLTTRKRQVFNHNSQTCIESKGLGNRLKTPKLWVITHENVLKTRKKNSFQW